MNAQKYFEQHAEELIASYAGKNVVLFFRGFVPANVRWLAHREDAVLPAGKILNEDGTVSIAKIDAAKRKLVQSLMMQEEGVTVCIYEEMLAILQNVQDPKAMFDAEFIVVDNNAFPAYVPAASRRQMPIYWTRLLKAKRMILRRRPNCSAIIMPVSANWMSAIICPRSTSTRAKTSAACPSTRSSRPLSRMWRQRLPMMSPRWCWPMTS